MEELSWHNSRWLPSSSWEKITSIVCARWQCLNPRWQNSRWLPSSSWVRMNEWSFFLCKMAESKILEFKLAKFKMAAIIKFESGMINWSIGWMQRWPNSKNGRIQDGCHHQVKWEWMSLKDWISLSQSQSEVQSVFKGIHDELPSTSSVWIQWVWVSVESNMESEFCAGWLNPLCQSSRWECHHLVWIRLN